MGLKLVCGAVLDETQKCSLSYKAMLSMKDFKELNRLYKLGLQLSKDETVKLQKYSWLEN
jgi:hypothetical protein